MLEGILFSGKYGPMIASLLDAHRGATHVFYLDVSFEETLRRHATRAQAQWRFFKDSGRIGA